MSAVVLPSSLPIGKPKKMVDNDRKRAADIDDSTAPPLKKQITMSNGSGEAADAPKFGSINSSWQVDLEVWQL
jgi:hypothetical protein